MVVIHGSPYKFPTKITALEGACAIQEAVPPLAGKLLYLPHPGPILVLVNLRGDFSASELLLLPASGPRRKFGY
jgi:hypothetical protein